MKKLSTLLLGIGIVGATSAVAQDAVTYTDQEKLHDIAEAVQADRIEQDIRKLVSFGTRHTLSETESDTRGIGAARRWVYEEFQRISEDCGGCLEVMYVSDIIEGEERIPNATEVKSVIAIQRGTSDPDRYVLMSGDIDSRVSDVMDSTSDAPGANDNASGVVIDFRCTGCQ